MSQLVATNALLMCPFGTVQCKLTASSQVKVKVDGQSIATIADVAPQINIPSFGMCSSLLNPQVAAATTAALGVLTPQPCSFVAMGTWKPTKPQFVIDGKPCLCNDSNLTCGMGFGTISIVDSAQKKVNL